MGDKAYEINRLHAWILAVVLLGVGAWVGWSVQSALHADDAQNAVCDSMTELYETKNLGFNLAYSGDDWEIVKETYGEDAARAIMDARSSGGPLLGALTYSVVEACGEVPPSN